MRLIWPWWAALLSFTLWGSYFYHLVTQSPCGLLGTSYVIDRQEVQKKHRAVTLCTHPDVVLSRLKRAPTDAESHQSHGLFQQVTDARDLFMQGPHKSQRIPCWMIHFGSWASKFGILNELLDLRLWREFYTAVFTEYFSWRSFKRNPVETLLAFAGISGLLTYLVKLLMSLLGKGPIQLILQTLSGVFLQPIPTLVRMLVLPFWRLYLALFPQVCLAYSGVSKKDAPTESSETARVVQDQPSDDQLRQRIARPGFRQAPRDLRTPKAEPAPSPENSEEPLEKSLKTGLARFGLVGRVLGFFLEVLGLILGRIFRPFGLIYGWISRKPEPVSQAAQTQWLTPLSEADDLPVPQVLALKPLKYADRPDIWEAIGAEQCQNEFLFVLMKPLIPLILLITTGHANNVGLATCLASSFLIQRMPRMSHVTQHLLCVIWGFLHFILASSSIGSKTELKGSSVLRLGWQASHKDLGSLIFMMVQGGNFANASSLVRAPLFSLSYASGLALRILVEDFLDQGVWESLNNLLMSTLKLRIDHDPTSFVRPARGVGFCGGLFRHLVGGDWEWAAYWVSIIFAVFLGILPLIQLILWVRWKSLNLAHLFLGLTSLSQLILLVNTEFNGINGPFIGLWQLFLVGALVESLLRTLPMTRAGRGPFLLFLVMLFS